MAYSQISAFPVCIPDVEGPKYGDIVPVKGSPFHVDTSCKHQEDLVHRSLRIPIDPRFKAIKHYIDLASAKEGHFARVVGIERSGKLASCPEEMSFDNIASSESVGRKLQQQHHLQDRRDWQETFESSVSRLLIDFDLTHDPQSKLNHLDRLHEWFVDHGAKQQRKARESPRYLIADRKSLMMPGSTRNINTKLSGASLQLAGAYALGIHPKQIKDGSQTAR